MDVRWMDGCGCVPNHPSSHCPYLLYLLCSEFQQATQSDSERLYQLMCHLARQRHPMNKFFWGNSETLKEVPKKKVKCETLLLQHCNISLCMAETLLDEYPAMWLFSNHLGQ